MDIKGRPSHRKKPASRFSDIRPAKPSVKRPVESATKVPKVDTPQPKKSTDEKIVPTRDTKTIEINFSMPKLNSIKKLATRAKETLKTVPRKKALIGIGGLAGIIIIYFAAVTLLHQWSLFVDSRQGDFDNAKVVETPSFTAILPNGKPIEELGGWKRVSPPKSDPVFAYADKIGNVTIQVSQQKVPEEFKPDIDENVEQMAYDFGAKDKFTAGGLTLYVGQTFKGIQSVIFRKNDLMVLMKSESKLTNKAWGKYALSLR